MKKPHVTQLLDLLAKPALIGWANKQGLAGIKVGVVRQAAMDAGTSMHEQIERREFTDPLMAEGFERFMRDKEILAQERSVETEWFKGRYDARIAFGGETWLVDYKKSRRHRVYFEHRLQLAAYNMAEPADRLGIVCLPDFALIPCDLGEHKERYERILIALSQIWRLRAEIES